MTLTPEEIDALPDYTAAQMAKLWLNFIVELGSAGPDVQVTGPNNRQYTTRNLDEAKRMYQYWQEQAAIEAADSAGTGPFEYADLR